MRWKTVWKVICVTDTLGRADWVPPLGAASGGDILEHKRGRPVWTPPLCLIGFGKQAVGAIIAVWRR